MLKTLKKDILRDLKIADDLSDTPHPTDAEIDFIRNFAPRTRLSAGS